MITEGVERRRRYLILERMLKNVKEHVQERDRFHEERQRLWRERIAELEAQLEELK